MPVFAVHYQYVDQPEVVTEHRPAHRDFLRDLLDRGIVLAAGAYTEGPAGALLVFRGDDAAVIESLLADDPFQQLGLVASCEIRAWGQAICPWLTSLRLGKSSLRQSSSPGWAKLSRTIRARAATRYHPATKRL